MKECEKFNNMTREARHNKSLEHQRLKFKRLCQKYKGGSSNIYHGDHVNHSTTRPNEAASDSNSFSQNNMWVRNISRKHLTGAQEQLQKNY